MDRKRIRTLAASGVGIIISIIIVISVGLLGCDNPKDYLNTTSEYSQSTEKSFSLDTVPEFSGKPYVVINNNNPEFTKSQLKPKSFEKYGKLDSLGRCSQCFACIGTDLMPTEERESISAIKPVGWQSSRYDFIDGESLYNRCHLIAHQLTAENANERNLITGTRYLNTEGMLPFEEKVGNYVRETGNHVLYRVTPIYKGKELLARGVHMEAQSVEDGGKGIRYNVYCYNVQPKIEIDYATGKNRKKDNKTNKGTTGTYVININSKKFHNPNCDSVKELKEHNKKVFKGNREDLIENGYEPCGACKP